MGHWLSRSSLHFASFKYTACVNIPLHAYPTFPVPACWEAGGKFFIFSSLTYYNPLNVLVKRILAMNFFFFLKLLFVQFFLFLTLPFGSWYCSPSSTHSSCSHSHLLQLQQQEKWLLYCSTGRAASSISKKQGLEHSLVSSLNDYEKQLRQWSHWFKDWGMNIVATNAWVSLPHWEPSVWVKEGKKLINIILKVYKNIFQLKKCYLNKCWT